ncbi:MAG: hypothetical protein K0Q73_9085, partial [Paenibacillus sp.]|nr:hypothetical protein [Paenibacillus sp.]
MFTSKKAKSRLKHHFSRVMLATLALSMLLTGWLPVSVSHAAEPSGAVVIEDFESGLDGKVRFDQRRNYSGSMTLETNPKYVRSGNQSVRIDYDYIGVKENPSYVYIGPNTNTIPITGRPTKIGMWVYGNNDGHSLW